VSCSTRASSNDRCHVTRCKNFCSHNWRDDGGKKVSQLGFLLIYGHLCTAAVVIALVLSSFQWVFELSIAAVSLRATGELVQASCALGSNGARAHLDDALHEECLAGVTERLGSGTDV